ncbi:MAG: hypothetical protein IPQ12_03440 [Polaromonas sp.]|nr:hypothetical protein [Polaromonas sp.]
MFKRIIQTVALLVPLFLVACGGSSTDGGSTTVSYVGTYSGTTVGVNAGPTTMTVAGDYTVKGTFTINNRTDDFGVPTIYESTFDGKVDSSGKVTVNAFLEGALVMIFTGQINSSGALTGTYYEAAHPNDPSKHGSFSLQGPANGGGSSSGAGGSASSCTGSYVGTYDMPSHEERIRIRNMSLVANGKPVTGDDATDNAAAGGGGVDGGIYMFGSYAFETDANCNVVKGNTLVFYVYEYGVSGTVAKGGISTLIWSGQGSIGEFTVSVDSANNITGNFYHPAPDSFVYGVMSGRFTPNGKI